MQASNKGSVGPGLEGDRAKPTDSHEGMTFMPPDPKASCWQSPSGTWQKPLLSTQFTPQSQ